MKSTLFLSFFLSLISVIAHAQTTRYVAAGATGNGTSWQNASGDLQAMINESSSANGDSILVATGTFAPGRRADDPATISPLNRDNAFVLKSGVHILGGFSADGTSRDWVNTPTILSGRMTTDSINFVQAYHVIVAIGVDSLAILDGFTIQDGLANGSGNISISGKPSLRNAGGGIYIDSAQLKLNNIIIQKNTAAIGGGVYLKKSSPAIYNSTILYNNSTGPGGGGLYMINRSNPKLFDVTIFSNGATTGNGAGVYITDTCSPELLQVTISRNMANSTETGYGGGIYCGNYSNPLLTNVQIRGNHARFGSGLTNAGNCLPVLTNTLIAGNYAVWHGGGIYNWFSSIILTNVTITGNRAANGFGGAMVNESNPGDSILIRNSVIYWNERGNIYHKYPTYWTGTSPNIHRWHSMVQYYTGDSTHGNIGGPGTSPQFMEFSNNHYLNAPFTYGDFSLQENSILRERADIGLFSAGRTPDLSHIKTDLAGNKRRWGPGLDIGAYEFFKIFSGNDSSICSGSDANFYAGHPYDTFNISYHWQLDVGNGFENITGDVSKYIMGIYNLKILQPPSQWLGYRYRLAYVRPDNTTYSPIFTLRFGSTWLGYEDSHWENPGNWSCATLPDKNVEVIISGKNVVVSTEVYCKKLTLINGATLTVNPGGHIHVEQ